MQNSGAIWIVFNYFTDCQQLQFFIINENKPYINIIIIITIINSNRIRFNRKIPNGLAPAIEV